MKDAYQVLQQKEGDLARVRKEIESLTIVAALLADSEGSSDDPGSTCGDSNKRPSSSASETISPHFDSEIDDGLFSSFATSGSKLLSALKRAK